MPKMSQIREELRAPKGHKHTYIHTRTALYREIASEMIACLAYDNFALLFHKKCAYMVN